MHAISQIPKSTLRWFLNTGMLQTRPHTTPLCTTQGSPRALTRTKGPPRRTTEVHLLGHHGIEPHLGQKPKLGGRYTDTTLIYISCSDGSLYIHCFAFFLVLVASFSKTQKYQKYFRYFSFFVSLLWFALKEKSKKILLCLVCFVFVWFFFVCLFLKNQKHQKYLLFFFGFVSSL